MKTLHALTPHSPFPIWWYGTQSPCPSARHDQFPMDRTSVWSHGECVGDNLARDLPEYIDRASFWFCECRRCGSNNIEGSAHVFITIHNPRTPFEVEHFTSTTGNIEVRTQLGEYVCQPCRTGTCARP